MLNFEKYCQVLAYSIFIATHVSICNLYPNNRRKINYIMTHLGYEVLCIETI